MALQIKTSHREQRQRTTQVSLPVERSENQRPVAVFRVCHSCRDMQRLDPRTVGQNQNRRSDGEAKSVSILSDSSRRLSEDK